MFKKHKGKDQLKKVPLDLSLKWQDKVFGKMGIDSNTTIETAKESCRIVMLETSKFYENLLRVECGMKIIEGD